MHEIKNGYLVISLDFELLWGVFDKVNHREKETYFKNTREIIPEILNLFTEYEIHSTWATVGMLFNSSWKEWQDNVPEVLPIYQNNNLSPYQFIKSVKSEEVEFCCFARDLIQQVNATPNQEIATHTYSHYYCLEKGQTLSSFEADLRKAINVAGKMGIELKSLVFPRNQFNEDYLSVCYKLGIENVRSNPTDWYWRDTHESSLSKKIFRTGDAYIGKYNKSYNLNDIELPDNSPIAQKASRFLRPFSGIKALDKLKVQRIKSEMTFAARNKQVYHLWWHPHNFGNFPEKSLSDLKILLEHYDKCKRKYEFTSLNMRELNSYLKFTRNE